ncbi:MAG: DUF998 domain-containing protein, partial [Candidatus Bathyarchaeia archaeon]
CGIIAPIIFAIIVMIAGLLRPDYSHLINFVSELGAVGAPNAIIQRINFVLVGILIVGFTFGLHRGIGDGKGSIIGPLLFAIFGLSAVVSGIFSTDPIQPGSFSDIMHSMSSAIGSMAAIFGFFIISIRLEQDILWERYRYFSIVIAFVAIVVSVVGTGLLSVLGAPGLAQRLFMAVLFLWIEVMAIRLFQISGQSFVSSAR